MLRRALVRHASTTNATLSLPVTTAGAATIRCFRSREDCSITRTICTRRPRRTKPPAGLVIDRRARPSSQKETVCSAMWTRQHALPARPWACSVLWSTEIDSATSSLITTSTSSTRKTAAWRVTTRHSGWIKLVWPSTQGTITVQRKRAGVRARLATGRAVRPSARSTIARVAMSALSVRIKLPLLGRRGRFCSCSPYRADCLAKGADS